MMSNNIIDLLLFFFVKLLELDCKRMALGMILNNQLALVLPSGMCYRCNYNKKKNHGCQFIECAIAPFSDVFEHFDIFLSFFFFFFFLSNYPVV